MQPEKEKWPFCRCHSPLHHQAIIAITLFVRPVRSSQHIMPQSLFQRVKFQESTQREFVSDYQTLFELDAHILSKPERTRTRKYVDKQLEKEVSAIIQRLEASAERVSSEIVSKFLEKPIQLLRNSEGDLDE
ncbi:hypothetical protein ACFX13_008079 [Malus domestica]